MPVVRIGKLLKTRERKFENNCDQENRGGEMGWLGSVAGSAGSGFLWVEGCSGVSCFEGPSSSTVRELRVGLVPANAWVGIRRRWFTKRSQNPVGMRFTKRTQVAVPPVVRFCWLRKTKPKSGSNAVFEKRTQFRWDPRLPDWIYKTNPEQCGRHPEDTGTFGSAMGPSVPRTGEKAYSTCARFEDYKTKPMG